MAGSRKLARGAIQTASQNDRRLSPGVGTGQPGEVIGQRTPARKRAEQAVQHLLQHRRTMADLGEFPDRRVDDRVERDNAPNIIAPHRPCIGNVRPASDSVSMKRPVIPAVGSADGGCRTGGNTGTTVRLPLRQASAARSHAAAHPPHRGRSAALPRQPAGPRPPSRAPRQRPPAAWRPHAPASRPGSR